MSAIPCPPALQHSPWGNVQHAEQTAPGLIAVSTAGHGGLWLAPERREAMAAAFPGFRPWGGGSFEWLEEDCDVSLAAILWPVEFSPQMVSGSVGMVGQQEGRYFAEVRPWLESPAGSEARRIAEEFNASVADLWEVGCMAGGGFKTPGWRVQFSHRTTGEQRHLVLADYPSKRLYSTAELEQFGPENKKDEEPPSRPLGEGTVFPVPAYEQIHRRPACRA